MALNAGLKLLDRAGEPDQAAVIRERMATQVFHLSRLVEDLLDVSRIDQGKIALRLERVQFKDRAGLRDRYKPSQDRRGWACLHV